MRILIVCKRQYTGRDLLDDRYGRLYALPVGLAQLGHEVVVVATSYRRRGVVDRVTDGVHWIGADVASWPAAGFSRWRSVAGWLRPDVVLASSDALHLIAGERFARSLGVPAVLDLYDDYEAFGLTRIPGLRWGLRSVCSRAARVVTVSRTLAGLLPDRGSLRNSPVVIGNGVPAEFCPNVTRAQARSLLNLPSDLPLVGTAGALTLGRGIGDLIGAYKDILAVRPGTRLVVAGPREQGAQVAFPPGTIHLGHRSHAEVALLFRALDVGVVCNRDNAFARACHPMKLVEMAACGLPAVAADLGDVSHLLAQRPDSRYPAGDCRALSERILAHLVQPQPLPSFVGTLWPDLARTMSETLICATHAEQIPNESGAIRDS